MRTLEFQVSFYSALLFNVALQKLYKMLRFRPKHKINSFLYQFGRIDFFKSNVTDETFSIKKSFLKISSYLNKFS